MRERHDNVQLWAWPLAGLVAVVVALSFAWSWPLPLPLPAAGTTGDPAVVVADSVANLDVAVAAVARAEAALPGVYGRLLDNRGEPLLGFQVLLRPSGRYGGKPVTVGSDGSYSLSFKTAGDYTLSTGPFGSDNVLEPRVQHRALVDLRACEAGGREQFSATIEVFAGEQRVRSHEVNGCQRFRSHLPPGDYRVQIDRGGVLREHALVVGRDDIHLRLRP